VRWARFRSPDGRIGFGVLKNSGIEEYEGDMFGGPLATGRFIAPGRFSLLSPCTPSKIVALWNNFGELGAKLGKAAPKHRCFSSNRPHP